MYFFIVLNKMFDQQKSCTIYTEFNQLLIIQKQSEVKIFFKYENFNLI